jgi:tetratricopeptide (TPR) repeat protein
MTPSPAPAPGDVRERTRALVRLRRYAEAAATARSGLAGEPDDPELAYLYASALSSAGNHAEALPAARRAVGLQPGSARAQQVLGWASYKAGHHADAAAVLAHAISLDPHDAESHVMRADALIKLVPRSRLAWQRRDALTAEAHAHAAEAVRLRPAGAEGYLVHAKACLAQGDPAGARGWAERGLAIEPDHPVGHQILGLAAQIRGDTAVAADHFVDAGRLDPRSDTAIRLLRGLRTTLPVGGIAVFVALRAASLLGASADGAAALAVVAILAFVGYRVYGARWHARRRMSDQARLALARDRELRGHRPPR